MQGERFAERQIAELIRAHPAPARTYWIELKARVDQAASLTSASPRRGPLYLEPAPYLGVVSAKAAETNSKKRKPA
jgi:hypothetical protein